MYVSAIFLFPGYALLKRFAGFRELETISLAPVVSILLYGGIFYPAHVLFGMDVSLPAVLLVLAVSAVLLLAWGVRPDASKLRNGLALLFVLALAMRLVMVQYEPEPRIGDGEWHFLLARSFISGGWFSYGVVDNFWSGQGFPYHASYRPPLYNFVLSLAMAASQDYRAAQLVNVVLASLMAAPVYLLSGRIVGGRYALFAASLVLLNSFMVDLSLFLFPRILLMYLALVFVWLYFRVASGKDWMLLGAVASLGFLTHYSFAILLFAAGIHLVLFSGKGVSLKKALLFALVFAAIASPWLARNYLLFGDPFYSESRYMRFADGWGDYTRLEPPTAGYLISKGYAYVIEHKMGALLNTFVMLAGPVRDLLLGGTFSFSDVVSRLVLPGSSLFWVLTPLLFPFAICGLARKDGYSRLAAIYLASGLGFGLFLSWLDMPGGFLNEFFSPLVPLMLLLGVGEALRLKRYARPLLAAVAVVALAQTLYVFWFNHFSTSDKGYDYPGTLEFADSEALRWIGQNAGKDDVVMSDYALAVNYYTGRRSVVVPNENAALVAATAERYNVTYLLVDKEKDYGLPLMAGFAKRMESGSLVIYGKA